MLSGIYAVIGAGGPMVNRSGTIRGGWSFFRINERNMYIAECRERIVVKPAPGVKVLH